MKNISIKFSFSDELIQEKGFIKDFRENLDYQIYYLNIKEHFGKQQFILSDKNILDKAFVKAISGKGNYKYSKHSDVYFDSLFEPVYSGKNLTEKEIKNIQTLVFDIYEKYGRKGLTEARNLYLSQGIMDIPNYILIKDSEDIFDLEYDSEIENIKILELNNKEYDSKKRIFDVLNNKLFIKFKNENAKSALFRFPQLLYNEHNELIEEAEMVEMLTRITNSLPQEDNISELDEMLYYLAIEECTNIYIEKNYEKIPKKSKEKVKTKVV